MPHLLRSILASALAPALIFAVVALAIRVLKFDGNRVPWRALSIVLIALLSAAAVAYLFIPGLFEDAETDIACISALAMRGLPIYPAIDAAPRYILLYGPMTYIAHIPLYAIFGQNLAAFKLLGVGAFLVSLFGLYRICRAYVSKDASLVGVGCAALVLFRYTDVAFWGRIDPVILVVTVLCFWSTVAAPMPLALAMQAVAIAMIPNLKISGFAYLIPALLYFAIRRGWRAAAAASALGLVLLPVPFLLPSISLNNYLLILRAAAGHGLVMNFLVRNIQYSALLLLPLVAAFRLGGRASLHQRLYLGSIITGLAITSVLGSKSGAGSYHLIPYIVPILPLYLWRRSEILPGEADAGFTPLAIAWAITTVLLSSTNLQAVIREYRAAPTGARITAEIRRDQKLYRGRTMEIGVGGDFEDRRTRYAYLTTFDGAQYTISGAAIRDLQEGGIPIPASTIQYIERCGTQVWLIPKGDAPFSASNSYFETPHAAFEPAFRDAFAAHYRLAASGELFDVWACRT